MATTHPVRFVIRDDTGDVPRSQIAAQVLFLNAALTGHPGVTPTNMVDRQGAINWNLIEFVDETDD